MTNSLFPVGMGGGSIGDQVYELEDKCLSHTEKENTAGVNSMTQVIVHRTSEREDDKFRDCHCGSWYESIQCKILPMAITNI